MTTTDAKDFLASLETIPLTCNDAPSELIDKLNTAMKALCEDKSIWLSTADLPHEIWREIADYNGDYLISIFGRVKSFKQGKVIIRTPDLTRHGYSRLTLHNKANSRRYSVHRLVAEAFIPNVDNKPQINHIDTGKANNCVWNLEWVSQSENNLHAIQHGVAHSGITTPNAKLTAEQVCVILSSYAPYDKKFGATGLAKKFNVDVQIIFNVLSGRHYKNVEGRKYKPRSYISEETRSEIRHTYIKGDKNFGTHALARKFGVSRKTIANIVNKKG